MASGRARIGTSGYQYDHWRGVLYPEGLPKSRWLAHYVDHFDTVEINNTFYRLPRAEVFQSWRAQAPDDFLYAIKFSRYGTHLKHLKDPEGPIGMFLERAEDLGPTFGPILVQLPPGWRVDTGRLDAFLAAAPQRHPWAVEFRNATWLCEPVYRILEAHNAAMVIHDAIPKHPRRITADWVYLRFHGGHIERYGGSYAPHTLRRAAEHIREHLDAGLDVYAYFNNDIAGHAVRNAMTLRRYVAG